MNATLPMGDGTQTPDEFVRAQSASTGLPEHMCRANMKKNAFVLGGDAQYPRVADARAVARRALDAATAKSAACRSAIRPRARCSASCCRRIRPASTRCGCRSSRCRSGWCSSPARRSRGRRIAWRPLFPRPAFRSEAISIYPGGGDVGAAVLERCARSLIFGGTPPSIATAATRVCRRTVRLLEDPARRRSGGSLGAVSRHDRRERVHQQRPGLHQLLRHLGEPAYARDRRRDRGAAGRRSGRCRRSIPTPRSRRLPCRASRTRSRRRSTRICRRRASPTSPRSTARDRARQDGRCGLPAADRRALRLAGRGRRKKEYMFPFVTVVECPEAKMLDAIGPTLVCSAITCNESFRRRLLDAVHIDRLNLGPVPTTQLNWLSRTKAISSSSCSAPARSNRRRWLRGGGLAKVFGRRAPDAHPVHHRRRRRDVLRELLPRQRARGRADGARSRRDAIPGLHADADRRGERQPTRACSSAASASTCSSTRRSSAGLRVFSIGSGIPLGSSACLPAGASRPMPRLLGD